MMAKTLRIHLSIPGHHRAIAADVVLADLAKKLQGVELTAGVHEIILFGDGSIVLDNALYWQPTKTQPVVEPRRKAR